MNFNKNTVYWIIYKEQEYHNNFPQSKLWTNDLYPIYGNQTENSLEFEDCVEMVSERIRKDNPNRYAIVSDTDKSEEIKILHSNFISNNIIDISFGYDREKVGKQIEWIISDFGINKTNNIDNVMFCSDSHFFHRNIIKYCNRPWNSGKDTEGNLIITEEDVDRMNENLISNWNSVVGNDSVVWFLGDFCLGPNQKENIPKLVSRLNGKINLVLGNHDHHSVKFYYEAGFHRVYDRPVLWNDFFILSHAPVQWVRNGSVYANLHGHVHNQEMYNHVTKNTYNCCVEVNDYKPISFAEIKKKMENCALQQSYNLI